MKAVAVHPHSREVTIVHTSEPVLERDSDVKLRILDVGVCGTDREICAFEYGTPPPGEEHLVLGHESLGEVIEVGRRVRGLEPGDLVVPMVRRPCGRTECLACREGRQDFCFTGEFRERGINQMHGFMTEAIVDDVRYMNRVPRALRDVAVLVEPLTIAEKAMSQVWNIQARLPWGCPVDVEKPRGYCHRALVLGAGPVGLLGAMTLVLNGFETFVHAREPGPNPRTAVLDRIGAKYLSGKQTTLADAATHIGNIDLVFEATGASKISFDVLQHLGKNGIFVLTGVPGRRGPVEIDTDLVMRNLVLKNQILMGTVNAGKADFEAAIRDLGVFVERWPDAVRAIVTGRHAIDSARELLLRPPQGIKEVIVFS
jgi:threonine dehydrogenase-like Zn-dependent dehydrogenase